VNRLAVIGPVVVVLVAVVAVVALGQRPGNGDGSQASAGAAQGSVAEGMTGEGPPDAALPDVDHEALVAAVHQEELGTIDPVRLAPGLVPPTNRWFSGAGSADWCSARSRSPSSLFRSRSR